MPVNKLLPASFSIALLILTACDSAARNSVDQAQAIKVTRDNYQYAEAIRNAENYVKLGGGNKWVQTMPGKG